MNRVNKGRKIVLSMAIILFLIDLIVIASVSMIYAKADMMSIAYDKIMSGIFRLTYTGVLLYYLYKGRRWAKRVLTVLLMIAGAGSLLSLVSGFNWVLLSLGLIYVSVAIILILSRSVNDFFLYKRGEITFDSE